MSARVFLVTSATTPLGAAVVRALAPYGSVLGLRAPDEPPGPTAPHVADLTRARDVRDLMLGPATEARVDTIVHLGGEATHGTLALATRLMLDAAEQAPQLSAYVARSSAGLYRVASDDAVVIDEHHPLELGPALPAGERAWLEADVAASQRIASARVSIAVLRLGEVLDRAVDGRLARYLAPRVCLRPLGFDPMLNVLALEDAARAFALAAVARPRGIFNVRGAESLPLSEIVHRAGRTGVPVPDALIAPLYALRRIARANPSIRYAAMRARFHYGAIPDGRAAAQGFGYSPTGRVAWDALRASMDG
jgi:UDP-glucose 4-epimerase